MVPTEGCLGQPLELVRAQLGHIRCVHAVTYVFQGECSL